MSDIIQLLPDSVANQIAAGEVIQRPASIIKELMENALDAGSTDIKIVIKDAGRTLVQVIDNGSGMSPTDARLAFERHATSKIKNVNDLFSLRTMGFRGEALASIAAVAQTELKTKKHGDELGTHICISDSIIEKQETISCPCGSNFIIKNLFHNVPARRKFLKKDSTELIHIINEFQRVALANHNISFSLEHNGIMLFSLPESNLLQRIKNITSKNMSKQLVAVEVETDLVKISGFIGKPEAARKTSGDQFFFVNQRYMRHPYFHKAITEAYSNLIQTGNFPAYFLFFEVDPQTIDINIHPTKTEIKFEQERIIWRIINAAVKESLGKHNMIPSIDFDTDDMISMPLSINPEIKQPTIEFNPLFNPFETDNKLEENNVISTPSVNRVATPSYSGGSSSYKSNPYTSSAPKQWEQLYRSFESEQDEEQNKEQEEKLPLENTQTQQNINFEVNTTCFQFKNKYILTPGKSGLMIIDQHRAHKRILFEQLLQSLSNNKSISQQCLFPDVLDFNTEDALVVEELLPELLSFGLDLCAIENNKFEVRGIPITAERLNTRVLLDEIIENYKHGEIDLQTDIKEQIAKSIANQSAIRGGHVLSNEEMNKIIGELFACKTPNYSTDGKTIISTLTNDEIETRFK